MQEIIVNLHMHTRFSDGHGDYAEILRAAQETGVDVVIVTDHNVRVRGVEGWYGSRKRRVLLLTGEEVHDRTRQPQKNHLLVLGVEREMAPYAHEPQRLIDAVRAEGGLSFIAHPLDPAAPAVGEGDISWVDWEVQGFTGLELWNGFSEYKARIHSWAHALFYAFFPQLIARGPFPETLSRWDALLRAGRPLTAVGGSDAHALRLGLGPLKRVIFPYAFHFGAVNTHLLLDEPLRGDLAHDRAAVLEALARGRGFIGYDLPAPTRGFRFRAHGREAQAEMGERLPLAGGVTLQIRLPERAECRLLRDGQVIRTWTRQTACVHIARQPGVYRVEVWRPYWGRRRGWIFSNPIYIG